MIKDKVFWHFFAVTRYGPEEEDRQWDSGGGDDYYYSNYYRRDRYENKINRSRTKRSASNKELTRGYSESMDEDVGAHSIVFAKQSIKIKKVIQIFCS